MLNYDPVRNLRHYPIPMGRFGKNPYGENLYRIVFAPSRRHLVYGEWPDGSQQANWVRKYFQVGDQWIMECWLPAAEYACMPRERWDREMLILGPYPDRGEYELCHVFETCAPSDASLAVLINVIKEGRRRPLAEKIAFERVDAERERKAIGDRQEAMIRNWLPAFGTSAMAGYGGGRGVKTAPILRTAEELGLPTQGGQFRSKQRPHRPEFQVRLEI